MKPKVSLFEDSFFSTKAEILKYTRLRIEMLRSVKFYKLLYGASRNRLSYFRNIVHKDFCSVSNIEKFQMKK